MIASATLSRVEAILDASRVSERIEALLPVGVRPRQLSVRTLLTGMLIALCDGRPAHLTRVHAALISLSVEDKQRLGVIAQWKTGPHLLTYRQTERTFALVVGALSKQKPDGRPSQTLSETIDALLEASVAVMGAPESSALAIDWTDYESFARPPRKDGRCADAEGSWGHRRGDNPGQRDEPFYGYYLQAATIVTEDGGPQVPELVRRIQLTSCHHDPPGAFVSVIERMAEAGIALGDILADCGYSYREAANWALPLRRIKAKLVCDLHPNDRGIKGTHMGALIANGNLYCPATPRTLLELSPPASKASVDELTAHDTRCDELARYKLSALCAPDQDGYHRVICPAAQGKIRCPLRGQSMTLPHERPTILSAPQTPPACCTQQTITVPPSVNAKTASKHDWPSKAFRLSYKRRSAAERTFSQVSNPATNDISKGWCRLMGLTPKTLFLACAFVTTNTRVTDAFTARQAEDERRRARGLPPRTRRRRRRTIHNLVAGANAPPAKTT